MPGLRSIPLQNYSIKFQTKSAFSKICFSGCNHACDPKNLSGFQGDNMIWSRFCKLYKVKHI
ncbi:unnamed protein product [Paramecium sonneborni]|uniref:Uncharacterized protein n=1 Tax=Paramecium sonneborni TaxID=65129 RepID=A0A8S1RLQ1_9CILI|nr:unnamed protein product [Paramecium sonneborni]